MSFNLQLLFTGIGVGSIYALVALGFALIYRATNVVNFAQGDFAMLGAFSMVVLAIDLEVPYWLSIVITGMPSRLAISLSWDVACIFLPINVRSKNTYCSATIATATTRMTMYWVSKNTSPMEKPGTSGNTPSSVCGRGP